MAVIKYPASGSWEDKERIPSPRHQPFSPGSEQAVIPETEALGKEKLSSRLVQPVCPEMQEATLPLPLILQDRSVQLPGHEEHTAGLK